MSADSKIVSTGDGTDCTHGSQIGWADEAVREICVFVEIPPEGTRKRDWLLHDLHGKSMATTSAKRAKRKNTHVCYRRFPITGAKWAGAVGRIESDPLAQ